MPSEERATKVTERCAVHPNRAATLHCDECARPLCVRCAVPVRGRVLGPECLRAALGDEAPPEPTSKTPRRPTLELVAGAAFAVAVIATVFPWTRFGTGSGFAGAWASDLRWSMVVVGGSVGSLVCWVAKRVSPRWSLRAQVGLGLIGGIGGVMSIAHPPPFKHASIAPVVATALLLAGATAALIRARQASDLHR